MARFRFAEEVLVEDSFYRDVSVLNFVRTKLNISSTGNEEDVVVLSCHTEERVCDQKMGGEQDQSFLMYLGVLEEFSVKIPFTPFQMDVLKFINVAPSQIPPNSWAFIRGYEILCKFFHLEPSIGAFFHFYGTKDVNKGTWISLSAHPRKRLFLPYANNYKRKWRDTFARIKGAQGAQECSTSSRKPKFPLCWTSNPVAVGGYDFEKMSSYEQALVCFLENFSLINIDKLLVFDMDGDGDRKCMDAYLGECSLLVSRFIPLFILFLMAFVLFLADRILSGEGRKYLVEAQKTKSLDGYVSSNPAGLKVRKLKRKEPDKSYLTLAMGA